MLTSVKKKKSKSSRTSSKKKNENLRRKLLYRKSNSPTNLHVLQKSLNLSEQNSMLLHQVSKPKWTSSTKLKKNSKLLLPTKHWTTKTKNENYSSNFATLFVVARRKLQRMTKSILSLERRNPFIKYMDEFLDIFKCILYCM